MGTRIATLTILAGLAILGLACSDSDQPDTGDSLPRFIATLELEPQPTVRWEAWEGAVTYRVFGGAGWEAPCDQRTGEGDLEEFQIDERLSAGSIEFVVPPPSDPRLTEFNSLITDVTAEAEDRMQLAQDTVEYASDQTCN